MLQKPRFTEKGLRAFVEKATCLLDNLSEVSRIPSAIESGDPHAAEQLFPDMLDDGCRLR